MCSAKSVTCFFLLSNFRASPLAAITLCLPHIDPCCHSNSLLVLFDCCHSHLSLDHYFLKIFFFTIFKFFLFPLCTPLQQPCIPLWVQVSPVENRWAGPCVNDVGGSCPECKGDTQVELDRVHPKSSQYSK